MKIGNRTIRAMVLLSLVSLLGTVCVHRSIARPLRHSRQSRSAARHDASSPEARPAADWYYPEWMARAPYAPVFLVRDTESSLGPYASKTKIITLKDLVKMHGHPCDGLVTAACALSLGLKKLFPDGVVDRTDLCCVTNNSPCYGDVAAYLTGARIRFGTQKIDPSLKSVFILHRRSNGMTVRVSLRPGVFPEKVERLEKRVKSGKCGIADIRRLQRLQWAFARKLLQLPPRAWFEVDEVPGFTWKPDAYEHMGSRGDVKFKNVLTTQ